ncbi:MAG: DNA polymerase III subunit gamma/tau [Patescibacteria group bacterium]
MVFYRKYRPQKIDELDSKEVRDKLSSVLSKDDVHALLFTGPKGLGKTSTARIIAKVLNCEERQLTINNSQLTKKEKNSKLSKVNSKVLDLEPCNKCDQCISITNGSNIDVLEIDGASNRGIDEIRDLREKIKLSPASARKKVYIIDEVHMLTTEAFNALLKTLEEPPSHVVFILCTTEPHKVPATISSRCFQIFFKRATDEELVRSFSRIIESEKIKADKEALLDIAKFSDGSFRDGVKVLEELAVASNGKEITRDFVAKIYQTTGINKNTDELIDCFIKKDAKKGIGLIKELTESGIDFKYFSDNLLSRFHEILLEKVGVRKGDSKIAEKIDLGELKDLIELLSLSSGKIKYSVLPQLPIELALVEWAVKNSGDDSSVLPYVENDARYEVFSNVRGPVRSFPPISARSDFSSKSELRAVGSPSSSATPSDKSVDLFTQLIDKVKSKNQSIAGCLRGCSVQEMKNGELIIETKFKFHKEKLEENDAKKLIEDALVEITGKDTVISFVLKL